MLSAWTDLPPMDRPGDALSAGGRLMIRTDPQSGTIFSIHAPKAELVEFTADFNGHRERTLAMRRGPDGDWVIRLHPGLSCDVYRFRIDGRFVLDPDQPPTIRGRDGILRTICPPVGAGLDPSGVSKTA
jgi:hypothetical protein